MKRRTRLALRAGLALFAMLAAAPADAADRHITLLVTGQNNGTFEPCGCKGSFRGGLVRRATHFSEMRQRHRSVVALDTGDQTEEFSIADEFGPRREIRERTDAAIVCGMKQLEYDAVLVGDRDLAWGLDRYGRLYRDLPMIASNLTAEGVAFGDPLRFAETAEGRVAIIGLVSPEALALLNPETRVHLRVADPIETARTLLAGVEADVVIALTLGGASFDTALARAVPRIDVIVSQYGHQRRQNYDAGEEAIRIESPRNGLEVALLELAIHDDGTVVEARRESTLIEPGVPREPHLDEMFSALNYTVARLKLIDDFDFPRGRQRPADACRGCHEKQYAWWADHPHARTLQSLAAEGRIEDTLCLPCHVSGFEEDAGFRNLVDTPALASVTCTMCHNVDLAAHAAEEHPAVAAVPVDVCLMCHTREDSPRFENEEAAYIEAATCPKSD